jgi:hypothetical protein
MCMKAPAFKAPGGSARSSGGLLFDLGGGGFPLEVGRATFSLLNFVVLSAHKNLYNADMFRLLMRL